MKVEKFVKYVLVAGLILALIASPRTAAKVAASGEEQAVLQMFAEGESPAHKSVEGTKTQVEGLYLVREVKGVAIIPAAGVPAGSYYKVTDANKDVSKAAVAVAGNAAAQLGGIVGPCINVNYGKMVNGKFTETTEGTQGIMYIGLPDNFKANGARYAVAAVYSGGGYKIYENSSTNPNAIAVTVDQAMSAKVMYALIRY